MYLSTRIFICGVIASVFLSPSVGAQTQIADDSKSSFGAKLELGIENDSNVAIEEIDSNSASSDSLVSFSANLDYKNKFSQTDQLKLAYSFSQDSYDEFSEFDLRTNFVTADLEHDFGVFKAGGLVRYIVADLDSQDFLTLAQASLYASKLLNKKWFVRGDYTYSDKEFDTFADRDATRNAIGADAYYFMDGAERYWVFGYKIEDEDAAADQFDRKIHSFKVRYNHKFDLFNREAIAKFNGRFQIRDYSSITPSIGEVRDEDRLRIGTELEIPLNDSLFLIFEYEHSDYSSNLPSADYKQDIIAVKIGWQYDKK